VSAQDLFDPTPTTKRNPWGLILTTTPVAAAVTSTLTAKFTWQVGTNWPELSKHIEYFTTGVRVAIGKATYTDVETWDTYWQWIEAHGLQADLYLHLGGAATAGIAAAAILFAALYTPGGQDALRHVRGPQLFEGKRAIRKAKWKSRMERFRDPMGAGTNIHPEIILPMRREPQNLLFLGMPGSGKTQTINPIVKQIRERGDRCLIYDEKKEFTASFYTRENTLLIAPWDRRSVKWDIAADARTVSDAELFAARTIPVSDKDPVWGQGARLIIAGAIVGYQQELGRKWGWEHLDEFLAMPEIEMMQSLQKHYPKAAKFVAENSKTTQGLLLNLIASLSWISFAAQAWPRAWEGGISIRKWTRNDKTKYRTIILQNDPEFPSLAEPLINAIIALTTTTLLKMENSSKRRLWLILDEFGNLPTNQSILKWMSLARSKGGRVLAGLQDLAMITDKYGKQILDAMASMFGCFVALRVSGVGDTADYMSHSLGEREVERLQSTTAADGTISTSWQHQVLPVVRASDLTGLPSASPAAGARGYVSIAGWNAVLSLRWPIVPYPTIADECVPAAWTLAADEMMADGKDAGEAHEIEVKVELESGNRRARRRPIKLEQTPNAPLVTKGTQSVAQAGEDEAPSELEGELSEVMLHAAGLDLIAELGEALEEANKVTDGAEPTEHKTQQAYTAEDKRKRRKRELEDETEQ
jgi:hypothetical protein